MGLSGLQKSAAILVVSLLASGLFLKEFLGRMPALAGQGVCSEASPLWLLPTWAGQCGCAIERVLAVHSLVCDRFRWTGGRGDPQQTLIDLWKCTGSYFGDQEGSALASWVISAPVLLSRALTRRCSTTRTIYDITVCSLRHLQSILVARYNRVDDPARSTRADLQGKHPFVSARWSYTVAKP
jgi:hypothetical protein